MGLAVYLSVSEIDEAGRQLFKEIICNMLCNTIILIKNNDNYHNMHLSNHCVVPDCYYYDCLLPEVSQSSSLPCSVAAAAPQSMKLLAGKLCSWERHEAEEFETRKRQWSQCKIKQTHIVIFLFWYKTLYIHVIQYEKI